jgi:hypothetical protein
MICLSSSGFCFAYTDFPQKCGTFNFLAIVNTALCHVPVGTVFRLDGAPPHFSRRDRVFLGREFPDH